MVDELTPRVMAALHDPQQEVDLRVDATDYLDFLANAAELEDYLKKLTSNGFSYKAPLLLGFFLEDPVLVEVLQTSKTLLLSVEPYELRRYVAVNYPHLLPILASMDS